MEYVNDRHYPLWQQFVDKKANFVGGTLEDFGDSMDRMLGIADEVQSTEITDITLKPNGETSAFFSIVGKDFTCGFDVKYGGITAGEEGWLTFSGFSNHQFRMKGKE